MVQIWTIYTPKIKDNDIGIIISIRSKLFIFI